MVVAPPEELYAAPNDLLLSSIILSAMSAVFVAGVPVNFATALKLLPRSQKPRLFSWNASKVTDAGSTHSLYAYLRPVMSTCLPPVATVALGVESSLMDPKVKIVHCLPGKCARKYVIDIKQLQKKCQDEANEKRTAALSPVLGAIRALRGASFRCECGPARDSFTICSTSRACCVLTALRFRTGFAAAHDVGELVFCNLGLGGTIAGLAAGH